MVVCYDITDNRNRFKVMKNLKSKGFHAQLSFFEVEAEDPKVLAGRVRDLIDRADRIAVVRLSGRGRIRRVGSLFEGMEWVL